jgi:hypothetical protein
MADDNPLPIQPDEDSPALPSEREYPRMTFPAPGLSRIDTLLQVVRLIGGPRQSKSNTSEYK